MAGGRQKDAVWNHFERLEAKNTGHKAQCRKCHVVMHAIVDRMKKHHEKCGEQPAVTSDADGESNEDIIMIPATATATASTSGPPPTKRKRSMKDFVVTTSRSMKGELDLAVANMIYATNSSFRLVEHPTFKKMLDLLRPGYSPPTREAISGELLNTVYNMNQETCKMKLKDETVNMSLDGWSNVHSEPVICVAVTDARSNTYVTDTVDTSGQPHTAANLESLTKESIKSTEEKYGCRVGSIVTDNAANMNAMRVRVENNTVNPPISYGCAAHQMNLLAKDLDIPDVHKHIIAIVKYFRNTHQPAYRLKEAGGTKLPIPLEVRWNSLADTLEAYLNNWPMLLNVAEKYPTEIKPDIGKIHLN